MQAVILVGGEGTRLRPLTSTVPKPVVPLVDRPFIAYMLEWLRAPRRRRRRHVVRLPGHRACATCSATARAYGLRLRFVEEPEPRGTGRRAQVRRGPARRALPDAQRRRAHRHRPDRADRPARGDRRGRHARARARSRTRAPTASCACNDDQLGRASSSRSRAPTRSTRTSSRAGAYVLERAVLDLIPAGPQRLDRARGLAAARRRRALRLRRRAPTGSTSGRPSATCRATFDILEGNVAHRRDRRLGPATWRRRARARSTGGSCRRRSSSAAARSRRARTSARSSVLGDGVQRGRGHARSSARSSSTAPRSAPTACCATASSRAGVRDRRRLRDLGRRRPRRGRDGRGRQRPRARRASLPADGPTRRRDHVLSERRGRSLSSTEQLELDRETIGRVDAVRPARPTSSRMPEHLRDALWKVESAGLEPWDSPGGLVVAGMGGSAIGGELARAILGDHASRPLLAARAYGLPPWTTPDTTVLCASLLGQHRGDARLLRGGRRASAPAASSSRRGGKLAELARADGVPGGPGRRAASSRAPRSPT